MSERRGEVHKEHDLTKIRRCELLDLSRSSAYYVAQPVGMATSNHSVPE